MKELFPAKQVMGFVFSLLLTVVALAVYFLDYVICSRHDDSSYYSIHPSSSSARCLHACW